MSIAQTYSAQLVGLEAEIITIEVDISNGLHAFSVIGLGDRSVEESKDRVSAAIKNTGFISPKQKNQKLVVSLAPADVRKEGPAFDLAIAIGYLIAAEEIKYKTKEAGGVKGISENIFLGELSLEGNIRRVSGVLPMLFCAIKNGFKSAFIPAENSREASLAQGIDIYPVSNLSEVVDHITGAKTLEKICMNNLFSNLVNGKIVGAGLAENKNNSDIDMALVKGNEVAKRGLEIAAAGAHNMLMYGLPGTGKTMLAQSFPSILPPLSYEQSIEVTSIHSAARALNSELITSPPFRAPHHTASNISIIGGGALPKPGEITLAHRGVLFLDEFPEFDRQTIEALRQPLEEKQITVSRAKGSLTFPAQTILLASMNSCPCGKPKKKGCICSESMIRNYWRKISGPIADRIDIWVHIDTVEYKKLAAMKTVAAPEPATTQTETRWNSANMAARVRKAREKQRERFAKIGRPIYFNSEMNAADIEKTIVMDDRARFAIETSARRFNLSGRAFHRIMKVARTIADLDDIEIITQRQILEALQFRKKN